MITARSRREVSFRDYLDEKEKTALCALTALCNAADGTHYSPPDDADCFFLLWEIKEQDEDIAGGTAPGGSNAKADSVNYCGRSHTDKTAAPGDGTCKAAETGQREAEDARCLCAALCVFHMGDTREGKEIDELSAFTRPDARRSGCLRMLLETAAPLLRPVQRFAVYRTQAADAVLAAIGAVHGGDEHMMELCLTECPDTAALHDGGQAVRRGGRAALDVLTSKKNEKMQLNYLTDADGMDVQVREGMCACRFYGDQVYLYGMLIYARYRRKGFGRRFLTALFAKLRADGYHSVLLEVSSENLPAMHLYTSLGFEIKETVSYFYREH